MNQTVELPEVLGRVFDDARKGLRAELSPDEYEKRRQDFIFHITDCKDDLERLTSLYRNPESNDETATTFMIGFLYHVVPHLNAAGRLLLDTIDDPFSE